MRVDDEQAHSAEEVERLGGWDQSAALAMLTSSVRRPEQRVSTMSGGERRRVARQDPDRATRSRHSRRAHNHLDADTIDWLEEHLLGEHPGAVMLVTRPLSARCVATRTIEIAGGEVYSYDGSYGATGKTERAHAARTEQNRQAARRELAVAPSTQGQDWQAKRASIGRGGAGGARADRRQRAELRLSRPRRQDYSRAPRSAVDAGERRDPASICSSPRADRSGRSGSGRPRCWTLLGMHPPASGSVVLGSTRIAYFDQEL
jgi:ATP-binding cassette subfamily F protein uup